MYDSAYYYYQKALPLTKTINDYSILIPIYINLTAIYTKRGNLVDAGKSLVKAEELISKNDFMRAEAFYYLTSGELFLAKMDFKKAIQQLTKGYRVADSLGDLKTEQEILTRLQQTHAVTGNFEEAYRFSEIGKAISDTIFSEESSRKISELEVKFEVEKANMKIREMEVIQQADSQIKLYLSLVVVSLS
jgi:tetratricopeptide (TPR) repeat protein